MTRKFTKYPQDYVKASEDKKSSKVYATKAYTKDYTISDPILTSADGNFMLVIKGGIGVQDTPYTSFEVKRSEVADSAVVDIRINGYYGSFEGMPVISLPRAYKGEYAYTSYGFSSEHRGNAWVRDTFIPVLDEAVQFCDELNNFFATTSREELSEMCKDVFLDMGVDYDSYIQQEADMDL